MGDKFFRVSLTVLALIGLVLSVVSLFHYLQVGLGLQETPSFCNISATINCDAVNASAWSSFFGIPVAGYGATFYFALFLLALSTGHSWGFSALASKRITLLAGAVSVVFSITLFYISKFIIGSLCILCIGLYLVNFLLLVIAILALKGSTLFKELALAFYEIFSIPASSRTLLIRIVSLILIFVVFFVAGIVPGRIISAQRESLNKFTEKELSTYDRWRKMPIQNIEVSAGPLFTSDFSEGEPNAPIKILEYADVECPACRMLYPTIKKLFNEYKGKIELTFKNYPIDKACNPQIPVERHRFACLGAEFARCAGEQGKFFEALEYLFQYPNFEEANAVNIVRNDLIVQSAKALALDSEAIKVCLDSKRHIPKIQKDISDAEKLGLQGTPSLWINGKLADARSIEGLRTIINAILAEK